VATCAEEPRQLSDSLADAVHTPALKRRLSFCLSSTGVNPRHAGGQGTGSAAPRLNFETVTSLQHWDCTQREMSFGRQPSL